MVKPSVRGHPCKRKSVCLSLLSPQWGLTTALLNGSWVLGVSRGFHFWLPAAGASVQPSHEPPPEKEKTGTFRGGGSHNKSNCQPFGHMTYTQFPSGVWEKNFPLILLHSASRKLPLNAFKIDICVYISGSMTGCHLTGGVCPWEVSLQGSHKGPGVAVFPGYNECNPRLLL